MTKKTSKTPLTNKLKRGILRVGDALSLNKVLKVAKTTVRGLRKGREIKYWVRRNGSSNSKFFVTIFKFKENIMKNTWKIVGAAILPAILFGCGGGGGTPAPVIPEPVVNITATSDTCDIVVNTAKCQLPLGYTSTNATSATLTSPAGAVITTGANAGPVTVDVGFGSNTYTVAAAGGGGTTVKAKVLVGRCAAGSAWNGIVCVPPVTPTIVAQSPVTYGSATTITFGYTGGAPSSCVSSSSNWSNAGAVTGSVPSSGTLTGTTTFTFTCGNANGSATVTATAVVCNPGDVAADGACVEPTLSYVDKVIVSWTAGQLYTADLSGVTKVENLTSYQAGAIPLGNCGQGVHLDGSSYPTATGWALANCADQTGARHVVKTNPATGKTYNYTGVVPADMVFVIADAGGALAGSDSAAKVAAGWFYSLSAAPWKLHFRRDSDNADLVVKDGTFAVDGSINTARAYSKP